MVRVVWEILNRRRSLLWSVSRDLGRRVRRARRNEADLEAAEAAEEEALGGVLGELSDAIWSEERYLNTLQSQFLRHLQQTRIRMRPSTGTEASS